MAISSDSSKLITVSDDKKVKMYDIFNNFNFVFENNDAVGKVKKVAIDSRGHFFYTADEEKLLHMYDVTCTNGKLQRGFFCCPGSESCIICSTDGYYKKDWECKTCDYTVCATCINNADECIIPCKDNCALCTPQNVCTTCKDGFFKNISNSGNCDPCDHT